MNQLEYVTEIKTAADGEKRIAANPRGDSPRILDESITESVKRVQERERHYRIIDLYIAVNGRAGARVCLAFIYKDDKDFQENLRIYFDEGVKP
jgi:nuclear transport factor 2 (NTF2) superfamily protein